MRWCLHTLVALALLGGCAGNDKSPMEEAAASDTGSTPSEKRSKSKTKKRRRAESASRPVAAQPSDNSKLPYTFSEDAWAKLPKRAKSRANSPTGYPTDSNQRFVIFSASWCGGCVASVLTDVELAKKYDGRIEVGVALEEGDSDYLKAPMSRFLSDMPVWTKESTRALRKQCEVFGIPAACLVKGDKLLWSGGPGDAIPVIDAHLSNQLSSVEKREADGRSSADEAVSKSSYAELRRAASLLSGFVDSENGVAWGLVKRDDVTPFQLEVSVALARDAVDASWALNFAVLDTYGYGLWKMGKKKDAVRVAKRVIEVCDALGESCHEERERANEFISAEKSQ